MSVAVRTVADGDWRELGYGQRFGVRVLDLSRPMGGRKLGYNVQEIPPGKANVPYHAHYVNEELILVLEGTPTLRLDGAWHPLRRGDVVALPPGADSAHQLLNSSGSPARALFLSTLIPYELIEYPDSDKRGMMMQGLAREPSREALLFHEGRAMPHTGDPAGYFLGEPFDDPLGEAPPAAAARDPRIANLAEVAAEPYAIGAFRAERKRVARRAGGRLLGCSFYRVQPGDRTWPYHLQHSNEELALVLAGRGRLRTEDGEREVEANEAVAFPAGPAGAHAFQAVGEEPFEVLIVSTMIEPEVAEYPDSGKLYVMVGAAPGGDPAARAVDLVFRKRDAVPYETDEV